MTSHTTQLQTVTFNKNLEIIPYTEGWKTQENYRFINVMPKFSPSLFV